MTRKQAQIVELIAGLSLAERRELMEHVQAAGLLEETFYSHMSPEQRAQLDEGVEQAERGETADANAVFDRLASRFNFRRA
jgi:DNA-binding transcriptional MerR regulator